MLMPFLRNGPGIWGAVTLFFMLVVAGALSWCLFHTPLTLHDGLGPILDAQAAASAYDMFMSGLWSRGYLRPLRLAQVKWVFDLSSGHYFAAYKAVHAGLVLLTFVLFARVLRVRTPIEFVAATVATMVLVGHHAFFMLVGEAYPINHFIEILALVLLVVGLARGRPGWLPDLSAVLALAIAVLVIESGLLVWVAIVSCYLLGWRGLSRRALVATSVLVAGYLYLRFAVIHVGGPGLDERASGFLLERLEPAQLIARFGDNPLPFYAYNVASAFSTVFLSEPRGGVWTVVRAWLDGHLQPWMVFHVVSSALATLVVVGLVLGRWRRYVGRQFGDADRLMLLGLMMAGANAVMSYAYLKDEVLSVAAAFYASAVFAAVAEIGRWWVARPRRLLPAFCLVSVLAVVSCLWTTRAAGCFYNLRSFASKVSADWADHSLADDFPEMAASPDAVRLYDTLRREALDLRTPHAHFTDERHVQRFIEIR
ncbi:MAG: hypothetical protein AB1806_18315 [Acidobacteriota bacterium]